MVGLGRARAGKPWFGCRLLSFFFFFLFPNGGCEVGTSTVCNGTIGHTPSSLSYGTVGCAVYLYSIYHNYLTGISMSERERDGTGVDGWMGGLD